MKRPVEHEYRSQVAYTRELEAYCDMLEAAATKPDKDAEIERLRKALYYEENRFQRIGTHAPDCWKWGPQHYECALRKIKEMAEWK
jgi:hypothetical protein